MRPRVKIAQPLVGQDGAMGQVIISLDKCKYKLLLFTHPSRECAYLFSLIFRLLEVRGRLYELLTHCIPADVIMKVCKIGNQRGV